MYRISALVADSFAEVLLLLLWIYEVWNVCVCVCGVIRGSVFMCVHGHRSCTY